MWPFSRKESSGFSSSSTAEEVTEGIDGSGLTAIVTGASSGIGAETSRVLALRGVCVVMGVRNLSAGATVKEAILREISTAKVEIIELDLSSKASVRKFAADFLSLDLSLNILINNAGVALAPFMLSQDGVELLFATNHIGHFLLTELLLEKLQSTANTTNIEGRIINVSSASYKLTYREGIRFDKINDKLSYNRVLAYGQSKLANILHTNQLSKKLKEKGANITANSLHPGAVVTNLFRCQSILQGMVNIVGGYLMKNVGQGAATTCYLALHPQVHGVTGKYFSDCNMEELKANAADPDLAEKLWDFSMEMIN